MTTLFRRSTWFVLVATVLTAYPQAAQAVVVSASDAGFVTEAGGSAKGDGTVATSATYNYSVGRELHYAGGFLFSGLAPMLRNNYFVFDLTGITSGSIAGATLKLYTGEYESVDTTESFVLVAPADPGAALGDAMFLLGAFGAGASAFDGPGDPAIGVAMSLYGNISGGPLVLGGAMMSAGLDGTTIDITISPSGVTHLNSFAGGKVILGGKVVSAPPPGSPQQPFGFTGSDVPGLDPLAPKLDLTFVPEVGSAVCVAVGLMIMGVLGLRRSERSKV